jgi:polar amino acid transport system substrate-binding protein
MRRIVQMFALSFILACAAGSFFGPQSARAQQESDKRVADIVRAGKLRAGIGVVALHWAVKDPKSGELRGVAADIARALAKRLGVKLVFIKYPSPTKTLNGLKDSLWDIAFLGVDPSRATVVDFSPPFMQIDATYLLPAGSAIRNIAGADQAGVRIGASSKSVEEIVLKDLIKRAQLHAVANLPAGLAALRNGQIDVLAAPRPTAVQFSYRLPGSRVLDDSFHSTFGAIAVPKGQAEHLSYISKFIEEAKASGLVQRAIDSAGVPGVKVAPPGNPTTK